MTNENQTQTIYDYLTAPEEDPYAGVTDWTQIRVKLPLTILGEVTAIMSMVCNNLQIEDYSDIDLKTCYGDLIDESILNADKTRGAVSLYLPAERGVADSLAFLQERFKEEKLDVEIEINPADLQIDTYRASGAGGQHVNKTDSAIRITHLPTGIVVACQNERSQTQNKEMAMRMLISKLIEKREAERLERDQDIKGEIKKIEWGSQIRSYVFCPYTLVKDHRTGFENSDVNSVMNGNIQAFINDYLKKSQ